MEFKVMLKAKLVEQEALINKAIVENRAMNTGEQASCDALEIEIKNLEKSIEAQAAMEARIQAQTAVVNPPVYATPKTPAAENAFGSFGEQMMAVYRASAPGGANKIDQRLNVQDAATGLNESVPSDGGFLVQQEFSKAVFERVYTTGQILSRVDTIPLGPGRNGLKTPAVDETSRADGSRWGGIRAYWEGEADQITASKPKFTLLEQNLKKLTALVYVTDDLLEDAVALEAWLMKRVPLEINFKVEDAIFGGSGAGQPLGFTKSPCFIPVAKEAGQAADTIVFENIMKMWSRMWAPSRQNAVWLINQDCEPQLNGMTLSVGTGGVPVYLPAGGLSASPYSSLFSRPVLPVEYCPTLGDLGDIALADLSQYQAIDKGSIKTATSIHVRFDYNETAFRFVFRFDGQPAWKSALTPYKGSNTLSPFIGLAARA
jgi:HK97 family phage major capsid protein